MCQKFTREQFCRTRWLQWIFFVHCWQIVKHDLYQAICEFFAGGHLPKIWTSTLIVPIPKVPNPESFKDLRPISLCNFTSKIISKMLANILAPILPQIISEEQCGFVKGRYIFDNILLAQEMVQSL